MYKVTNLDHYGRGIIKLNNKTTFVENALPNEVIDIKITHEYKNFNEAKVVNYIETSNERCEIKCPYYNECGGCNIMHMSYEAQLDFKQNKIKNIVDKYLNNNIKINKIISYNNQFNYRNKITFKVKDNKIGFYKNNTHEIVEINKCLIANEKINEIISYLKKLDLSLITNITCRCNNGLMVIIDTNSYNLNVDFLKPVATSIYFKINNKLKHIYGDKNIYEKLEKYNYIISPNSFFQVNKNITIKLYNKIKEYVGKGKNVLDLYCGTGSIGIFINDENNVVGIEINESAIKDATKNKDLNKLDNTHFILGDSGKKIKELKFKPDVIIIDPPRSGLNNETLNNILDFNSKKIIYVSCDPMTLVRDLKLLNNLYNIQEITPFDMFPNTYHVECIALLNIK